jgi:uncharacterized protein YbjT (DUF2867 family)
LVIRVTKKGLFAITCKGGINLEILVTGANGYIGSHLVAYLLQAGHEVHCMVRDAQRFKYSPQNHPHLSVWEADLLQPESLNGLPEHFDVAFYLVHSMGTSAHEFPDLERHCAEQFSKFIGRTSARQIIYLSGIVNDQQLSKHLRSRLEVESILRDSGVPLTVLRAAIIIGSGSASFEILRDLVEKLPFMITPKWVRTRCQPIAIADGEAIAPGQVASTVA